MSNRSVKKNDERHYQYDHSNRLRSFRVQIAEAEPSKYALYLYDAAGSRVKKLVRMQEGSYVSTTYIDGVYEFVNDDRNHQNHIYIVDNQSKLGEIRLGNIFGDTTPELKYTIEDHLGGSLIQLQPNGALINKEEYYPFGETSFGSYGLKRYRFSGKERDNESGLYYYGARYYMPWVGRFVSVDPLADKYPFYTPYQYAGNKPINATDLDGAEEQPKTETGGQADNNIEGGKPAPTHTGNFIDSKGETVTGTFTNEEAKNRGLTMATDEVTVTSDKPFEKTENVTGTGNRTQIVSQPPTAKAVETPKIPINPSPRKQEVAKATNKNNSAAIIANNNANSGGYSIDAAVKHLDKNVIYKNSKGEKYWGGSCSPFVPKAINAGFGFEKILTNQAGRKYGPLLEAAGFEDLKISPENLNEFKPKKGDIAVMDGYSGGKSDINGIPYGHIQMYNGEKWRSDFDQTRPFWPGDKYESNKPDFKIYRWKIQTP